MKTSSLKHIKETLKLVKPDLSKKYGVTQVGIFGSFAFGDQDKSSDIDILVNLKRSMGLFKLMDLENYLAKKLGRKVDLVTKSALKKYIRKDILDSTIYV